MVTTQSKIDRFLGYLKSDPNNIRLIEDCAVLLIEEQQFLLAYNLLSPQLHEPTSEKSALLILAMHVLHGLGRLEEAIAIAEQLLLILPNEPTTLGRLALVFFDKQDWLKSKNLAEKALSYEPTQKQSLLVLESLNAREFQLDTKKLELLLKNSPREGRLWFLLGQAQILNGKLKNAQDSLQQTINLLPNFLGAYHLLIWLNLLQDQNNQAEKNLQLIMEKNSTFVDTIALEGIIDWVFGRLDNANKNYKLSYRLDKNSISVMILEVLLLIKISPEKASIKLDDLLNNIDDLNDKKLITWLKVKMHSSDNSH